MYKPESNPLIIAERGLIEAIYNYFDTAQPDPGAQDIIKNIKELLEEPNKNPIITQPADVAKILFATTFNEEQENFFVIPLNTRNRVINIIKLYTGTIDQATIRPAEVFRAALKENAANIIIAHNHPSGDPAPSPDDINITETLAELGRQLESPILDHIVFTKESYHSIRKSFPSIF